MSSTPFASLNAGMLVRKGSASPSLEASYRPASAIEALSTPAPVRTPEPTRTAPQVQSPRPRLVPTAPAAPCASQTPRTHGRLEGSTPEPAKPDFAARAGVRLTREQARALKLAALLLDRPQQELLSDGLDLRLEAVACGPLSHCACFQAAIGRIAKP